MTQADKLLERLVKRVNDSGVSPDIVLTVAGTTMVGQLAPRAEWLRRMASKLEDSNIGEFAADFTAEAGAMDTEEYLHLWRAYVVDGSEGIPPKSGLFRLPLSSVDAWALGTRMD
jgi:hypothetical protein